MNPSHLTEETFRRYRKEFLRFSGFAQNVEALVSLILQASGSICTIATTPFSPQERQQFLSMLVRHNWSTQITPCTLRLNGETYNYDAYQVRVARKQTSPA